MANLMIICNFGEPTPISFSIARHLRCRSIDGEPMIISVELSVCQARHVAAR